MSIVSRKQQRLMYAAASGTVKGGPSKAVAKEMIEATPKKAFAKLPEQAGRRKAVMQRKPAK
jgi:hypothetical protein